MQDLIGQAKYGYSSFSIIYECEDAFVSEIINTNTVQNTVRRG